MYLTVTSRKGISSPQLSKQIGVTQPTAWFMQQRIREACGNGSGDFLRGIVEVDEAYVEGREASKHERKKRHAGRGTASRRYRECGNAIRAIPSPCR